MIQTGPWSGGGGELPYMGYLGVCCYEGYGFQAVYSGKGYINPTVWVQNGYHLPGN